MASEGKLMKKWMWFVLGPVLMGALAAGAVKLPEVAPRTVSSVSDILETFYESRSGIPPIPSPIDYRTVAAELSDSRFDFLSSPEWAFPHNGGTLYLSSESKLKLSLPMVLTAYEDLASGKVVLTGTPVDSKKIETLAVVDAPPFSVFDQKVPVDTYRMNVLWPRRVIWTAMLREEASFLAVVEESLFSSSSLELSPPQMMSMPGTGSEFRIIQSGTDKLDLSVNVPPEFIGATVDLKRSTNLVEGVWSTVLQTNAASTGTLFLAVADIPAMIYETSVDTIWQNCPECAWDPGAICTNQTLVTLTNRVQVGGGVAFYHVSANGHELDEDGDGLFNLLEYEQGTDWQDIDSDNDGLLDGEAGELDPLTAVGVPDEFDSPMQSASNGVFVVLPERCWHAQESSLNLETYGAYEN